MKVIQFIFCPQKVKTPSDRQVTKLGDKWDEATQTCFVEDDELQVGGGNADMGDLGSLALRKTRFLIFLRFFDFSNFSKIERKGQYL